jgi:hypothetical protein
MNKRNKNNKYSAFTLLFIYIFLSFMRFQNPPSNPISWDTFGYYLYLPMTFTYHDLAIKNKETIDKIFDKYDPSSTFYQATKAPNGNWVMKYSMGMAFFYAPAFIAGNIAAKISGYPADGFSKPYQTALVINSILFFMLGFYFLRKVLLLFFDDKLTMLLLLLLFFGTNYYTYAVFSGEIVHNYLFGMYALILWLSYKWNTWHRKKDIVLLAVVIGFTTLARPTELISIIIPLLWGVTGKESFKTKLKLLRKYKTQLFTFFLILAIIASFQIAYWKIITGHFIYYSYVNPGEGFEFLWPYTLKVLFSFRKGWLIYTPLMIFAVWGFYNLYKEKKEIFYSLFIFFVLNLYIVSSWSCWWYAQCFGQRALVQSYAVMAIPLGYFLNNLRKQKPWKKFVATLFILFFVTLNLFQIWQMRHHILSSDRMTFAYYIKTFGKTSVNPQYEKLLLVKRDFGGKPEHLKDENQYIKKRLAFFDFEQKGKHFTTKYSHSGKQSLKMDSTINFSPAYRIKYKDLTDKEYAWIRVSVWVYPVHPLSETPVSLVTTFQFHGKNYKYRTVNLNDQSVAGKLKLNSWNKISMDYLTPEVRRKSDNLITYVWYRGKKDIYFDDFKVELFEPEK